MFFSGSSCGIFLGSPGISWGLGAFASGGGFSLPKEQWLFGPWPRKSQKRGGAESNQSRGPSGSKRGGTGGNSWAMKKITGWLVFLKGIIEPIYIGICNKPF